MYSQEFYDLMNSDPLPVRPAQGITKDQEREALEKIRGILRLLPDDSYVKTAFAGCCELAEDNINFDWLLSMPARISYLENLLYERDHGHGTI